MDETYNWNEIKIDYPNTSLLLGNGFSLMFDQKFDYNSLYDKSKSSFSEELNVVFEEFETKNFEKILRYLELTKKVNRISKIEYSKIDKMIIELKEGKWKSIFESHPKPNEVNKELLISITRKIRFFSKIFTTNYDLLLYYMIMYLSNTFGDMFSEKHEIPHHLKFIEDDDKREKYVYYLHGCLFLMEHLDSTSKITKDKSDNDLLDRIKIEFDKPFSVSVFVTEGNSERKLKSIYSNNYLKYCFKSFENDPNETILIYGHSLSEEDNHIVDVLDNNYETCIICLYFSNRKEEQRLKKSYSSKFNNANLIFVDSKTVFF